MRPPLRCLSLPMFKFHWVSITPPAFCDVHLVPCLQPFLLHVTLLADVPDSVHCPSARSMQIAPLLSRRGCLSCVPAVSQVSGGKHAFPTQALSNLRAAVGGGDDAGEHISSQSRLSCQLAAGVALAVPTRSASHNESAVWLLYVGSASTNTLYSRAASSGLTLLLVRLIRHHQPCSERLPVRSPCVQAVRLGAGAHRQQLPGLRPYTCRGAPLSCAFPSGRTPALLRHVLSHLPFAYVCALMEPCLAARAQGITATRLVIQDYIQAPPSLRPCWHIAPKLE